MKDVNKEKKNKNRSLNFYLIKKVIENLKINIKIFKIYIFINSL